MGVIFDKKLNWQKHIDYVCTKLSKTAGIIFKLRKKVPRTVLLLIYNSLAASYIRYGITSWGLALISKQNRIDEAASTAEQNYQLHDIFCTTEQPRPSLQIAENIEH